MALEKSQMQPLVINDCDLSVDDDFELSQNNITEELPAKVTTVCNCNCLMYKQDQ